MDNALVNEVNAGGVYLLHMLLSPTGALVLMMVYYIYIYISIYPATFSDFEHLCLSILLQVSL